MHFPFEDPKTYIYICICVSTDSTFMEFIPFVVVPNVYINWLVYKNTFGNPISILSQGSRGDNFFLLPLPGKRVYLLPHLCQKACTWAEKINGDHSWHTLCRLTSRIKDIISWQRWTESSWIQMLFAQANWSLKFFSHSSKFNIHFLTMGIWFLAA